MDLCKTGAGFTGSCPFHGMYQYQLGTAAMFRQNAPHGRDLVNGWINTLALATGLGAPEALVADLA